jgi:hypothetical protein
MSLGIHLNGRVTYVVMIHLILLAKNSGGEGSETKKKKDTQKQSHTHSVISTESLFSREKKTEAPRATTRTRLPRRLRLKLRALSKLRGRPLMMARKRSRKMMSRKRERRPRTARRWVGENVRRLDMRLLKSQKVLTCCILQAKPAVGLAAALKVLHDPCGDEEYIMVDAKDKVCVCVGEHTHLSR